MLIIMAHIKHFSIDFSMLTECFPAISKSVSVVLAKCFLFSVLTLIMLNVSLAIIAIREASLMPNQYTVP